MEQTKPNKIYKYKNRVIIRTLLAIFTVVMMIFSSLALYALVMVGPDEILSEGSVKRTARYQDLVNMEMNALKDSLKARQPFETNGELDMNKNIDIMNPQEMDADKRNKNTTFTVGDIMAMNQQGVFNGIENIASSLMVGDGNTGGYYAYSSEYSYEINGEIQYGALSEEQHMALLVEQMEKLELATPISGKQLMEYVLDNPERVSPVEVFEALKDIVAMQTEYDDIASKSSSVGTNLRYYIKDDDNQQIVTNGNWKSLSEAEEVAKEWGVFLACKRGDDWRLVDEDSTVGFESTKLIIRQQPLISRRERIVITIDPTYPVADQLSQFNYAYYNLKPYFMPFLVIAILGLIGIIVSFILATLTTGQDEKKGEVRLNIFDRVPTEIGASIVCLVGLVCLVTISGVYDTISYGYGNSVVRILYMIGMLMTAIFIATWGYLSLVRRIKAKDLWKNSLWRRVFSIAKKAYRAGKMNVRLVIAFVVFVMVHILFIGALGALGAIMLLIADAIVLVQLLKETAERQKIKDGLETIATGNLDYKLEIDNLQQDNQEMAEAVNKIADGMQSALEKSMKNERMRSELITNVSHDIKTPLTSIINYVDLLKREDIQNPQVKGYIDILDAKSQRLKHLTEDLVEASKVSSGNIELHMDNLFVQELLQQAEGEFDEKLKTKKLELVSSLAAEPVIIKADGRQMWRIFENLLNNIAKYALAGTRVYIDLIKENKSATLTFKNMSQEALNINADELTERFVRGDISRTTEGSGLGLSIAKSLTELQGGEFDIYLDGDLFKVTLTFDTV